MLLVGDILRRDAKLYGKKIGLIDGEKKFSYTELNHRVNRLANGLIRSGLEKGSKVAVVANNCHEFVETYFAIAKAGLTIMPWKDPWLKNFPLLAGIRSTWK